MQFLRKLLDAQGRIFKKGGRLEKFYPLYEAGDTFLFSPGMTTKSASHVRDGLDLKRMMFTVVIALIPAILMAMYNTGLQIHQKVQGESWTALNSWQTGLFQALGFSMDPNSVVANVVHGALYFLPVVIVCYTIGGLIEVGFAIVRHHEVNEGFLVTGMLIPLTLPPTIPLWQVAIGTAFGIIIGKEIFGGTGMNFLNPALTARAFLFFAYPADISGAEVWVAAMPPDAASGATWLARFAETGLGQASAGLWWNSFWGFIPGSMGETSAAAAILGALLLIMTGIGSWQTMFGVTVGTILMALGLNAIGSDTNPMLNVPFHWHMVVGGWAFGTVFMATDPVSSAFTNSGKLIYGFLIGVLAVLIRTINPAYPEGMMLAILFMNMFAPLIDHYVIEANKRRRNARYARA